MKMPTSKPERGSREALSWRTSRRSGLTRVALPLACLAGATGLLVDSARGPHEVAANTSSLLGPDLDADGLADVMELVLGTNPDLEDTDGDGFDDIEEVARHSDPLDALSIPGQGRLSLGMYTYVEGSMMALHTAIYVEDSQNLNDLNFELGVVINDRPITVSLNTYAQVGQTFQYANPNAPQDSIFVLEMPIPAYVISNLDQIGIYSIVRDAGGLQRAPTIDLVNVVDDEGELFEVVPAPPVISSQKGGGIVYRPLRGTAAGGPKSVSGQICWQNVAAVGSQGANLVYEVEDASCEDFDSVCTPSSCDARVGTAMKLPDPGIILGG